MNGETFDEVARGALRLAQPQRGYRFTLDALILADFAAASVDSPPDTVVDLGCGCGIVGLLLARRWPGCRAVMVEIQPELARLARVNAMENGLARRVDVVCGDLRTVESWAPRGARGALLVANPPYYRLNRGRISPDQMVATAKHELKCTLAQLLGAAAEVLIAGQGLALIHDAERRDELLDELARCGLAFWRERLVLPLPDRPARRLLCYVVRRSASGRADADMRPAADAPLVIHQAPGVYSAELRRLLGEDSAAVESRQ